MNNYILAYYQAIIDGSELVGRWVRLLYEMIVQGLEQGRWQYNAKKAHNAIRFIEKYCRHNKGKLAPQFLRLSLWQKAFISVLFGILDENGHRQFREVILVVGRKCGKTLLAAAIMAYVAFVDGEFGSEIYCLAPKLDQTDLVFSAFMFSVENDPTLNSMHKRRKNDVFIEKYNTTIKRIAFSDKKSDGYNPMLTVCDEGSSWPGARGLRQYEVMVSGTGAREEPITLMISSSGYENEGIYDELCKRGTRFLMGESKEMHLLPVLYMIDDVEKWDDINELQKSLPGLGVSVNVQFILSEIEVARESLSKKAEFITKYCNIKQSSSAAWLLSNVVQAARGERLRLEDFRGCYCVAGIDLSRTTDLTSAVVVIEKGGLLHVFAKFWLPRALIDEATKRDNLPYRQYIQRGLLEESGENVVDYEDCRRWMLSLVRDYHIYPLQVGYDSYNAYTLTQALEADGFHLDKVIQGENLTGIINTTEGLMKDGLVRIGDNDLLAVHLLDSAMKTRADNGRRQLIKLTHNCHIDGTAALLDAICSRQVHYQEIGQQLKNAG